MKATTFLKMHAPLPPSLPAKSITSSENMTNPSRLHLVLETTRSKVKLVHRALKNMSRRLFVSTPLGSSNVD